MANTAACEPGVISGPDDLGTAEQRLAAWRVGRLINQLRWNTGRAWILHDRQILDDARDLATALPVAVFGLGIAGPEFEDVLELAREIAENPSADFGSLNHVEELLAARHELQRERQLGEYSFPSLQQVRCRVLFLAATSLISELFDGLTTEVCPPLEAVLRLASHVDEIVHPTSDIVKMFTWQDGEEPVVPAMTPDEWLQGTTPSARSAYEPLPLVCSGPAEPPQLVDRQWLKILHGRWQRSPIPGIWCPINAEGEPAAGATRSVELVTLLDQIAIESLADLHTSPIRWNSTEGKLRVGTVTLLQFAMQAARQKELLQHFHEHSWSTPLSLPLSDIDLGTDGRPLPWGNNVVKDTFRTLKEIQRRRPLKFYHRNGQVGWRWAWGNAADPPND